MFIGRNMATLALADELVEIADAHWIAHRQSVAAKLKDLADLLKSVASTPRSKKL